MQDRQLRLDANPIVDGGLVCGLCNSHTHVRQNLDLGLGVCEVLFVSMCVMCVRNFYVCIVVCMRVCVCVFMRVYVCLHELQECTT